MVAVVAWGGGRGRNRSGLIKTSYLSTDVGCVVQLNRRRTQCHLLV